jgi:hypothetical protein
MPAGKRIKDPKPTTELRARTEERLRRKAERDRCEDDRARKDAVRRFVIECSAHGHDPARIVEKVLECFRAEVTAEWVYAVRGYHREEIRLRAQQLMKAYRLFTPEEMLKMMQIFMTEAFIDRDYDRMLTCIKLYVEYGNKYNIFN